MTAIPAFTDEWARTLRRYLNESPQYQRAAHNWEWPVVFGMNDEEGESRLVYLDLFRGHCRDARPGNLEDIQSVKYMISATVGHWQNLFEGHLDPMSALMSGKLRLDKGNLFMLSRYAGAAKVLLETARTVPTQFPV